MAELFGPGKYRPFSFLGGSISTQDESQMMHRLIFVALCIVCAAPALAQEPRQATLTFDAVTHYTDNTPIPAGAVISYRVFQGTCGSAQKQLVGTITETETVINSGLERGGNYGWQIVAVVNGEESDPSNEGCKAFLVPKTVTITVR